MRYGVEIPIAGHIVEEIGEDAAWQIARLSAARAVRDTGWENAPCTEETLPMHVSGVDPETGAQLPPIRLYRFLYTLGSDA